MVGYVLAYIGLVSIILRGVVLGKLIDRFHEVPLTKFAFLINMAGLIVFSITHNLQTLFLAITMFSIGSGLLRPFLLGEISRSAPENKQGEILGITSSLSSIAQIVGPILGGFALTYISAPSMPLLSMLVTLTGFVVFLKYRGSKAEQ
jgi:DHA1 family tetracycline resistance protein-like MFS transporter